MIHNAKKGTHPFLVPDEALGRLAGLNTAAALVLSPFFQWGIGHPCSSAVVAAGVVVVIVVVAVGVARSMLWNSCHEGFLSLFGILPQKGLQPLDASTCDFT